MLRLMLCPRIRMAAIRVLRLVVSARAAMLAPDNSTGREDL